MPYEISECVGLGARPPASGVGVGRRARLGSLTAAGCGTGTPEWELWAGRAELLDPGAWPPTPTRKSAGRARKAATGDRAGTPGADGLGLPGDRESGTSPHAPRVCVSPEKVFASLPQVERGVSKILGGDPKGDHFLYTNGKCVILRNIDVSTPWSRRGLFASMPWELPLELEFLPFRPLPAGWPRERGSHAPSAQEPHLGGSDDWTGLDCFFHPQPPLTGKLRLGSVWF